MSQHTKRPQNRCGACGNTWYPRGKDKSLKCPNCGKREVSKVGPGILGTAAAIILLYFLISGDKSASPPSLPVENNAAINSRPASEPRVEGAAAGNAAVPVQSVTPETAIQSEKASSSPSLAELGKEPILPGSTATTDSICEAASPAEAVAKCNSSELSRAVSELEAAATELQNVSPDPGAVRSMLDVWMDSAVAECHTAKCWRELLRREANSLRAKAAAQGGSQ